MNIEFQYLYRDGGNYKNFGSLVFGNCGRLAIEEIRQRIEHAIDGDKTLVASCLKVPELFFRDFPFDPELDHGLHEFSDVVETGSPSNDPGHRDILDLLVQLEAQATTA